MGDEASSRDHVGGHAISDKEDNVLCFPLLGQVSDKPCSLGAATVVVVQTERVLAGLIESKFAVCF